MKYAKILLITVAFALFALSGCGVFIDMAEDNEWRWGTFGKIDFVSPIKLRVGVAPFADEVGLGAPGAGANLANLMSEELAKDERLVVVPVDEVAQAMAEHGFVMPLNPQEMAELGTALRLNAMVVGSLSELRKYSLRKGWRRAARLVTSQRQYVDAVLAVSAVDAQTGIVLASRANTGEVDAGSGEKDYFEVATGKEENPEQEALEASLDEALREAYFRTRNGLANLPFKATIIYTGGAEAAIAFGRDVGLKEGTVFHKLEVVDTITNTIGDSYQIFGAVVGRLKVTSVSDTSAMLEILDGYVYPGDIIQATAK